MLNMPVSSLHSTIYQVINHADNMSSKILNIGSTFHTALLLGFHFPIIDSLHSEKCLVKLCLREFCISRRYKCKTPLLCAAEAGHDEVVAFLLWFRKVRTDLQNQPKEVESASVSLQLGFCRNNFLKTVL